MTREYPDRPWIGIGMIVFRGEDVLLIQRGKPPRLGSWSLPGGAQHLGEGAQDAARRELLEETGITVGPLLLADVIDSVTRDGAGAVHYHYTIVDYCAEWVSGTAIAGDDVQAVAWVRPEELVRYALTDEALAVIAISRKRLAEAAL